MERHFMRDWIASCTSALVGERSRTTLNDRLPMTYFGGADKGIYPLALACHCLQGRQGDKSPCRYIRNNVYPRQYRLFDPDSLSLSTFTMMKTI
jgi:hypothetical protein